jgi:murein DD-endopeptidase MepM/ murein hydrolase activator NlpD
VLATGDGVVTRVTNHPYAGRYVVIKHSANYSTRYLHYQVKQAVLLGRISTMNY